MIYTALHQRAAHTRENRLLHMGTRPARPCHHSRRVRRRRDVDENRVEVEEACARGEMGYA